MTESEFKSGSSVCQIRTINPPLHNTSSLRFGHSCNPHINTHFMSLKDCFQSQGEGDLHTLLSLTPYCETEVSFYELFKIGTRKKLNELMTTITHLFICKFLIEIYFRKYQDFKWLPYPSQGLVSKQVSWIHLMP